MTNLEKYNEILRRITKLLEQSNPCKFEDGRCISMKKGKRMTTCCIDESSMYEPCNYLTKIGCSTVNLPCKLFLCKYATHQLSEADYLEYRTIIKLYQTYFDVPSCRPNMLYLYMASEQEVKRMLQIDN